MKNQATKNYGFANKNKWRQWAWRQIASRVEPRQAWGLYLAAAADKDRGVAIKRGFNPNKLWIVERDLSVARALKKKGKVVLHGDLKSACEACQLAGFKPDFVHADLCGGLSMQNLGVIIDAVAATKIGGAVSVNLLCGRDGWVSRIRERFREDDKTFGDHTLAQGILGNINKVSWRSDHRGMMALVFVCESQRLGDEERGVMTPKGLDERMHAASPRFSEYRSGNLKYQSIVFTNAFGEGTPLPKRTKANARLVKSIHAQKAILTQRNNGDLKWAARA